MSQIETAEQISARWNKPVTLGAPIEVMAGGEVPYGDGRATASSELSGEDGGTSRYDAGIPADLDTLTTEDLQAELERRLAEADGDDDGDVALEDMNKKQLQAEIDAINESLPEDAHLSRNGNKEELVARINEYNASAEDDDGE